MIPLCPKCQIEMEEEEPNFEDMTDGQFADYEAGHWRYFYCPKCGFTDLYEGHFGTDFEKEESTSLTKSEKDEIRKRDNYTCQLCGVKQKELKTALSVHHILGCCGYFNDPEQLISLCKSCHGKSEYISMSVANKEKLSFTNPKDQERIIKLVKEEINRIRRERK